MRIVRRFELVRPVTVFFNLLQFDMKHTGLRVDVGNTKIDFAIEFSTQTFDHSCLVQKLINLLQKGGGFFSKLSRAPACSSFSSTPVNLPSSCHVFPPVTFRGFVLRIKSAMDLYGA